MIRGFFILLAFQLVGEVAARGLGLLAPGPVIGLALMVVALSLYQRWRPLDEEALAESDLGKVVARRLAAFVRARRRRRGAVHGPVARAGIGARRGARRLDLCDAARDR